MLAALAIRWVGSFTRIKSEHRGAVLSLVLVDYAERISNHLEDLIELDLFAKELDNTIPEKAH